MGREQPQGGKGATGITHNTEARTSFLILKKQKLKTQPCERECTNNVRLKEKEKRGKVKQDLHQHPLFSPLTT
jgi:hypothetical protein